MSLSKHMFIGRLTKAPEGRDVTSGDGSVRVVNFTVAVDADIKGQDSDFINVVAWRSLAETCERYLEKGRQVFVEGRPRTRNYDVVKDGVTFRQYVTEVIADKVQFLDSVGKPVAETPEVADAKLPF